jgi:phage-related minor tail protein
MKAKLLAQAAAYDAVAAAAQKAGKSTSKMSEWQKQGLMYQTTDFVTQVASGQNVMIAALQQGGQLKDQMGGILPMFRMLGGLLLTVEAAFVAVGAAAVLVGVAMYKGRQEVEDFNKQILLTGDYSKVTIDDFYKMSYALSNTTKATISGAKDIFNSMIQSGQFTYQTFDSVSRVIEKFAELSNLTSKQAADKLIPSLDGTASSALQLTKQYDFLTLAQYKHIELLNRQGKTQDAIKETADLLSASFNKNQVELGYINQALDTGAKLWSKWWDAAMSWGKPETLQQQLENVEKQLKEQGEKPVPVMPGMMKNDSVGTEWERARGVLLAQKESLLEQIRLKNKQIGQQGEKDKIKDFAAGGGSDRELQLTHQIEAAKRDAKYIALLSWQDEEHKIQEEGNQKLEELYSNYLFDINGKDRVFAGLRFKLLIEETEKEMNVRDAKLEAFRDKERVANIDAAIKEREDRQKIADEEAKNLFGRVAANADYYTKAEEASKIEKERLATQIAMVGMNQMQVKIAEKELQYQKDLVDLEKVGYSENTLKFMQAKAKAKRDDAIAVIELGDQLKHLEEVNDSVFKNMTDAMDKFIETGKISFADLTQSILRDLLKIELKNSAMALWGGSGGSGGILNAALSLFGFADGGDPPVNQVSMVGEKGPELFVPKTAGTIIPNNKLGSMGGTTTNNVYNINAIDTKSFEERILGSSRAVWAANAYGAKSVAVGRGRT